MVPGTNAARSLVAFLVRKRQNLSQYLHPYFTEDIGIKLERYIITDEHWIVRSTTIVIDLPLESIDVITSVAL